VEFTTVRVNAPEAPLAAERYASLGYTVFSFEYDLVQGKARDLRGATELDRFPPR
jgi:hypothetical protein